MSARISTHLMAKQIINEIYQPLGKLMCHVNSDTMWEYSKERAIEQVDRILKEIPLYEGETSSKLTYYQRVRDQLAEML